MATSTWIFLVALALGCALGVGALFGGELSGLDADGGPEGEFGGDGPDEATAADGMLAWLGVGRVPLGLLLSVDLLMFGGVGVVASELAAVLLPGLLVAPVAAVVATVLAPLAGARLARSIARFAPSTETHGASRASLIGRWGRAELTIDRDFGRARVPDAGGAIHFVRCTTAGPAIERGAELLLVAHDETTGVYRAERA
jgi:membrane protein implicated in regulation of membrane protease activity